MPHMLYFDTQENILITEFMINSQSLHEYYYDLHTQEFMLEPSSMLGKMMANYHRAFDVDSNDQDVDFLSKKSASTFFLARPTSDILSELTPANLQLLKIIQGYPELSKSLEDLWTDWHVQTLIHGDLRWENIIITYQDHAYNSLFQMKIVDWELAHIGDPAWDIGGAFQDYLRFWLLSLPVIQNDKPDFLVTSTRNTIFRTKKATRAFWHSYIKDSRIKGQKATELLIRSTKYCAAQLIQSIYESNQWSTQLSNIDIYTVQTGFNILQNTEDAIPHLLGIPLQ
jgi:Phosphotransferase enzyme family